MEEELGSEHAALEAQQNEQLELQGARENAAKREDEATERLNELRLALATERQRYENLIAQRQPMAAREAELAETIAARQAEIANFEKRLAAQSQESKSAEAAIEKQKAECAELEATVAALTDQRAEHSRAMNEMESDLRASRNSLNELHDLRSKQQVRESQLQMQSDNLVEHISRRYQLNLREFAPDQVAFEKTLRAQLKAQRKTGGRSSCDAGLAGTRPSRGCESHR